MLRIFLGIFMCLGLALALEFSALDVTPYGHQSYDIATGITILRDGGTVRDREGHTEIQGSFIRYRQDDFVEVQEATLTNSFGSLQAAEVHLDFSTQVLEASGPVVLKLEELSFSASALTLHLSTSIAVATGGVEGDLPAFSGAALLVDVYQGDVLLVGPYRYEDEGLVLESQVPGDLLYLQLAVGGDLAVSASTTIPEALLERFGPYLGVATDEARR